MKLVMVTVRLPEREREAFREVAYACRKNVNTLLRDMIREKIKDCPAAKRVMEGKKP